MIETTRMIDNLSTALMEAVGHMRSHCACRGSSVCVPCEVARDSHAGLEVLRAWRAQAAEVIDTLDAAARMVEAATERRDECAVCSTLHEDAAAARRPDDSWEESHG